ncbi:hypothetical protein GQX74_014729 [Glossina fuscipes]|nr:hypothetical protein GQX74_014729 [Glossina fuscipes]
MILTQFSFNKDHRHYMQGGIHKHNGFSIVHELLLNNMAAMQNTFPSVVGILHRNYQNTCDYSKMMMMWMTIHSVAGQDIIRKDKKAKETEIECECTNYGFSEIDKRGGGCAYYVTSPLFHLSGRRGVLRTFGLRKLAFQP